MNTQLEPADRKWIAWLVVVVLIAVSSYFGITLPTLPPMPETERGHTGLTGLEIIAPTDQPTATPAMIVDSYGVSNLLEVRDAATPVFAVRNGGTMLGVIGYGTAGQKLICSQTTITGTGAIPHALSTPVYVVGSIAEDITGKSAHLSFTNSSATVTAKIWNTALTPAASDVGVKVDWCVVGTP